jgi:hypothetical protein
MNLSSYDKAVRDSAKRFAEDTGPHERDEYLPWGHLGPQRLIPQRAHEMTILHDDGLYRHLLCKSPDHSTYWFELITAPGSLTFRGDGESFVFARERDMFGFFRSDRGAINPTYWSEKLTSDRDAAFKYDERSFRTQVWEHVRQYGAEYRGLAKAAQEHLFDGWAEYNYHNENEARAGLDSFKYEHDVLKPFTFTDTWEWDFKGFDWWFLWACQAIVWGIARYDEAKRPAAELCAATAETTAP